MLSRAWFSPQQERVNKQRPHLTSTDSVVASGKRAELKSRFVRRATNAAAALWPGQPLSSRIAAVVVCWPCCRWWWSSCALLYRSTLPLLHCIARGCQCRCFCFCPFSSPLYLSVRRCRSAAVLEVVAEVRAAASLVVAATEADVAASEAVAAVAAATADAPSHQKALPTASSVSHHTALSGQQPLPVLPLLLPSPPQSSDDALCYTQIVESQHVNNPIANEDHHTHTPQLTTSSHPHTIPPSPPPLPPQPTHSLPHPHPHPPPSSLLPPSNPLLPFLSLLRGRCVPAPVRVRDGVQVHAGQDPVL